MADEAKTENAAPATKAYILKAGKKHDAIENGEVVRKQPGDEVQLTDAQALSFADKFFLKDGPEHAEANAAIAKAQEAAAQAAEAQAAADEAAAKAADETANAGEPANAGDPPAGGGEGKTGDDAKAPAKK